MSPNRCHAPALAAVAWLVAAASPVFAGAFTQPQGTGQALAVATITSANRSFDGNGGLTRTPDFRKIEVPVLIEYGITDWLTVMAAPSYLNVEVGGPNGGDYSGAGYTDLGARLRLHSTPSTAVSVQALMRLPGARDETNPAEAGSTDGEIDLRALYGVSVPIDGKPAFVDVQAAYRIRQGAPPDEWRLDATFGIRLHPELLLLAQSFNVISNGDGEAPFGDTRYHKAQLSVVWDIQPDVSLQFGGVTTYAGENALQENGLVAGLWYRF